MKPMTKNALPTAKEWADSGFDVPAELYSDKPTPVAGHTPDQDNTTALQQSSRLPWRVVKNPDGFFEVWTRADDTPGSQNNYVVADGIQFRAEAELIASAPYMRDVLKIILNNQNNAYDPSTGNHCLRIPGTVFDYATLLTNKTHA